MADDQFIKSNEPADNRYGQGGYTGASSVVIGEKQPAQSKFAPKQPSPGLCNQTRTIDATPEAKSFGMRDRNGESSAAKVPTTTMRK